MVVTEPSPPPEAGRAGRSWRGRAFGLELDAPCALPGLLESNRRAGPRQASLELVPAASIESAWPAREGRTLVERTFPGGRLMMRIEGHSELGYRIWAPRYGRHLVSADGRRISSALPRLAPWRWQRLFFAQVLPLASALQGLELFHASAVSLRDRVIAFAGGSGVGKTSLAAHLVARGAKLATDDVLALEPSNGGVLAHPGAATASVGEAELRAMGPEGRKALGKEVGRSDKIHLAAPVLDRPQPLSLLYFPRRSSTPGPVRIVRLEPPDTRELLAASFLLYLQSPGRLLTHLDVCARIARSVRTYRVLVPPDVPSPGVAAAVEAHAVEALEGG
jgi:hypothetical protein